MGFYDALGVQTVITASETLTRLGGSRMAPETLAAMAEAAASFVPMDALQARAGEIIAEITRLARRSPDVNQRSGVSVRASIADYESLLANAAFRDKELRSAAITAPIGARLAHRLPQQTLKRAFAVLLALVALNMLREAFS